MLIQHALEYVRTLFQNDFGGHDFYHTWRVYQLATKIAEQENADLEIVQLAALLHDVDDRKLSPKTHETKANAVCFMREQGIGQETVRAVCDIIASVSFSENRDTVPQTLEGKCVQDADRLDALGAIGIARTFAYGGSHKRPIYDPNIQPGSVLSTSVNHFHEKLFLLCDMMQTRSGQAIAEHRDAYIRAFYAEFMAEWDGIQ